MYKLYIVKLYVDIGIYFKKNIIFNNNLKIV